MGISSLIEVCTRASLRMSTTGVIIVWHGCHLQQTPRPRHKKQSDCVVEQSSFPLIALFWLKIGRCRGRNWLYGNQDFVRLSLVPKSCLCAVLLMQASISSITIPPRTPGDLHQKFAPTLALLHPRFCQVGGDLLGQLSGGLYLSINDVCHFWNCKWQELATDNTLGFTCCSDISYVFKKII